ncbi:hypothetical protein K2O51_23445 [Cupriavidus pinatubonensis]|uniref:helix-turn-helix domain-containing protein n=1 Tax=Cupriavidus pinatubonensis TaxID=248026 RepID=UPI001C730EF6|nr:helix-turn-helix domain-containing protein [Cupriavidus pinatubonensis]QYY30327.1 hypothetical protein K2O51_23445 [Cupriavidus pinatubonensis]
MRDTAQIRDWLAQQKGRRGAIAKRLGINPKTLERITNSPDYYPRSDTLEKIDGFITAEVGIGLSSVSSPVGAVSCQLSLKEYKDQ